MQVTTAWAFAACALIRLHAAQVVYQKQIPAAPMGVDAAGNVYFAGTSTVTKLDPAGTMAYTRTPGIGVAWTAMAVSASGEVVLAGTTTIDGLPTTPGVVQPSRNSKGICIA